MANRMNRREFLLASALLAAATQAPAAQVKRGGKLRYATDADVLHLAPWVAMTQSHIFYTVMIGPDSRAPGMPMMAEILQADLKKIGVNLKIEQVEAQVCSDRWTAGRYDMSIHSYGRLKEPGELFRDECFCIPVAAVPRTIAYRKSVMNFDWSADGYIRAENMWLDKA